MLNHTEYFTRLHCEITTWLLCNEFFILAALLLSPDRASLSPPGPCAGTSGSAQPVILAWDNHTCAQGLSTARGERAVAKIPLQPHCSHPTPRPVRGHKMAARSAAPRFCAVYAAHAAQAIAYSPTKGPTAPSGPSGGSTGLWGLKGCGPGCRSDGEAASRGHAGTGRRGDAWGLPAAGTAMAPKRAKAGGAAAAAAASSAGTAAKSWEAELVSAPLEEVKAKGGRGGPGAAGARDVRRGPRVVRGSPRPPPEAAPGTGTAQPPALLSPVRAPSFDSEWTFYKLLNNGVSWRCWHSINSRVENGRL